MCTRSHVVRPEDNRRVSGGACSASAGALKSLHSSASTSCLKPTALGHMPAVHPFPLEVLQELCEWLIHGQPSTATMSELMEHAGEGVRTVATLARTSRTFYEPCINALWHTIPSVALLFYTMPTESYQRARPRGHLEWRMFVSIVPLGGLPLLVTYVGKHSISRPPHQNLTLPASASTPLA